MLLLSEYPQLMLYSSHASAHDSVLAVGDLHPSECRVLAIPNDTITNSTVPSKVGGNW